MKTLEKNNEYQEILSSCAELVNLAIRSRWDLITYNFQLGEKVVALLEDSRYGDKTIIKLARDISCRVGKPIFASQLYDCGVVYRYFGSFDQIEALEQKTANPITWNFLLQSANLAKLKNVLNEKAKTIDPEYLTHLRRIKQNIRELRKFARRNELHDEVRNDLLTHLINFDEDIHTLIKEFADTPPAIQLRIFKTMECFPLPTADAGK